LNGLRQRSTLCIEGYKAAKAEIHIKVSRERLHVLLTLRQLSRDLFDLRENTALKSPNEVSNVFNCMHEQTLRMHIAVSN